MKKVIIALLFLMLGWTNAHAINGIFTDIKSSGTGTINNAVITTATVTSLTSSGTITTEDFVTGGPYIDSRKYATLALADAAAYAAGKRLKITQQYTISTAMTFSSYVKVEKVSGSALVSSGTGTIVFNGGFNDLVTYQTFTGFTTPGSVSFANGTINAARAEWFAVNTTPGTTDMTTAVKMARASYSTWELLNGANYKITDTLVVTDGQQIVGHSKFPFADQALIAYPATTRITFAPTSLKDLFDIQITAPNLFASKVYIGGFFIVGNSTGGDNFSRYAINSTAAQSVFENLGITYFQAGINCDSTMTNEYRNIELGHMITAGILTGTNTSTTETFFNVLFHSSPWGAKLQKAYSFRFIAPLFEALTVGAIDVYKESRDIEVIAGYGEDVPTSGATNPVFRVGSSGTTPVVANSLTLIGGTYLSTNASGTTGTFLDVDYAYSVKVLGTSIQNFSKAINTTANTTDNSIFLSDMTYQAVTTLPSVTSSKIFGAIETTELNGARASNIKGATGRFTTAAIAQYMTVDQDLVVKSASGKLGIGNVAVGGLATLLHISQLQDNNALRIYGYDDMLSRYGEMYIDSLGYTNLVSNTDRKLKLRAGGAVDIVVNEGTSALTAAQFLTDGSSRFKGRINPDVDDSYYLGAYSVGDPLGWKGLVVKDTTNGNYYKIEVTNGALALTQLN